MTIFSECQDAPRKRFLLFFTTKKHDFEIQEIGVHMAGESDSFKVRSKCRHCGKMEIEHFVQYETLRDVGYSKEELQKALTKEI